MMNKEIDNQDNGIIIEGNTLKRYDDSAINEDGIVVVPEEITEIGWAAFARSEVLKEITLPHSLKHIDDYAFLSCQGLQKFELPSDIHSIGNGAFSGIRCSIEIAEENSYFSSEDGILYNKEKSKILACPDIFEHFTLPKEVTEIAWSAFRACSRLKSLRIAEGVKILGEDACYDCPNLEEILLPESLEEIGWLAFSRCKSLKSICLPNQIKNLGWALFSDCRALTSIELPESLETIGLAVFAHCHSLEQITLPKSLKEIGGGAFSDCPKLKEINCLAETPPLVEDFDFKGKLFVPKGTKTLYQEAKGWKACSAIFEL